MMDIKQAYYDIGTAVKGVCEKVYARNRPKSVENRPGSYIVVRLPYSIKNEEMDFAGMYNDYTTTAQIEIYVKDTVSSRNPNGADIEGMAEKVERVMNTFPIMTENIVVTRPRVTLQTDDGEGYGVAIVTARVRTR